MRFRIPKFSVGRSVRFAAVALLTTPLLAAGGGPEADEAIYATGFEAPTFVKDKPLVGQDGWVSSTSLPLSPNAAVITADKSERGKQNVRVRGQDLVSEPFINTLTNGFYDAIGSYRRPVNYDTGGTQVVAVSADVRVNGPRTPEGNHFFSAGIAAVDGNGDEVGEMVISSDGDVYVYSGNGFVPTYLDSIDVERGEWHSLAVVADFAAHTSSFFVDGEYLDTFPFDPGVSSPILRRGSLVTYAAPDTATQKKAAYTAHYDNFSIEVIPWPSEED